MSTERKNSNFYSEDQIAEAKTKIREALLFAGLTDNGAPVCPIHGRVHSNALTIKTDRWFCYSAGQGGNAVTILTHRKDNPWPFPKAIQALLGLPDKFGKVIPLPDVPLDLKMNRSGGGSRNTKVDFEVYQHLLDLCNADGGQQAAADHYGRWHINPDAVAAAKVTMLMHPGKTHSAMLRKFERARLLSAGLVTETRLGRLNWLVNAQYPIIEPHILPDGKVVGLQFRASQEQEKKIAAHKEWAATKDTAGESDSAKVPFVPKFLSLAGVDPLRSLVGGGLPQAARLAPGTEVLIVEGIKDMLAAWTMGKHAVAIPGTSAQFAPSLLGTIRPLTKIITLDGDEAGAEATEKVIQFLQEDKQQNIARTNLPPGMDVTDVLVQKSKA